MTGALKDLRPALKTVTTEHDDLEHFDDEVCGPSGLADPELQLFWVKE